MNDPVDENEFNDDALDYNMAVYNVFCYHFLDTNQRRGIIIIIIIIISFVVIIVVSKDLLVQ